MYVEVGGKELGRIANVRGCFIGLKPETEARFAFRDSGIDSGGCVGKPRTDACAVSI